MIAPDFDTNLVSDDLEGLLSRPYQWLATKVAQRYERGAASRRIDQVG
jgi:hypothetical protein